MRIAIVGAGIVGVTTALELAEDGHEVTVFDSQASLACGTSFANAGVIAPGYVTPWAAPGMPWKVLAGLLSPHSAVRFGMRWPLALPWLWRFLRACRAETYASHRSSLYALAAYSRQRLDQLEADLDLDYERSDGYLVLLRAPRELAAVRPGLGVLERLGVPHRIVDAEECRRIEPGLSGSAQLHGGVHLPQDRVGNCRLFAQSLRPHLATRGVQLRFGEEVTHLEPGASVRVRVRASAEAARTLEHVFDAAVVCAGVQARALLAPLGLRVPVLPIYGYSLTAELRSLAAETPHEPRSGLMDERYKVALTRLGSRVRVAGSAELGGHPQAMSPRALATLHKVLEDWFPGCADVATVRYWKGARPMLPDGPPLIGRSTAPGIWLNLGHGSSGWALSCGSARALADLLVGRTAGLDMAPFDPQRLR